MGCERAKTLEAGIGLSTLFTNWVLELLGSLRRLGTTLLVSDGKRPNVVALCRSGLGSVVCEARELGCLTSTLVRSSCTKVRE